MCKFLYKLLAFIISFSHAVTLYGQTALYRAYEKLSESELDDSKWLFAGRAVFEGLDAELSIDGEVYWEKINQSGEFFRIKNDSIYWKGFNNGRRLGCLTANPVLIYSSSSANSSPIRYEVKGTLDATFEIMQTGTIEWKDVARGAVVFSQGDTIKDVRLSRMVRTVEMEDEEGLMTDTIVSYRWFSPNSELPIAIQTDEYLYVADENYIAEILDKNVEKSDQDRINDTLGNAEIELDGSSVTIKLPETLSIEAYIMDMAGNIYVSVSGTDESFSLSTEGLLPNTYVITIIAVDVPDCVRKILLTI